MHLANCRSLTSPTNSSDEAEKKAIKVRESIGATPATLPLAMFIGNGRSLVCAPWQNDPISRARTEALEKRIVSQRDITEAKHV